MSHVFVSLSSKDIDFGEMLCEKIKAKTDLATWIYTEDLVTGDHWGPEIDRAIEDCSALILIMTPDGASSPYVTYEWSYALGCGKPVLVIYVKNADLHPKLREAIQYIDFRKGLNWPQFSRDLARKVDEYEGQVIRVPRNVSPILEKAAANLDAPDESVRQQAVESVAQLATSDSVAQDVLAQVVNKLQSYETTCIQAALGLANLNDLRAVPGLRLALQYKNRNHKFFNAAIEAAARLKAHELVDDLLALLNQTVSPNKVVIIRALGKIADPRATSALCNVLLTKMYDERAAAAVALGQSKDPAAVPDLTEVLNGAEYQGNPLMRDTRVRAALALGQIATPEAIEGLITALKDKDTTVQQAAVEATGDAKAQEAISELIELLRFGRNPSARASAAISLGFIKTEQAVDALINRLTDRQQGSKIRYHAIAGSSRVCDAAAWALKQIETEKALKAVENWRSTQQ